MSVRAEQVKAWRKRNGKRMRKAFGSKCGICGYDRCDAALSFHHLDPTEKSFGLGGSRLARSWGVSVSELRKCVLLCANCHMEVEYCGREIPDDIQRFDESYATYVNDQGVTIGD